VRWLGGGAAPPRGGAPRGPCSAAEGQPLSGACLARRARRERPDRDDDDAPLADQLASLTRPLEQEDDPPHTLDAIVRAAVETVPGAQHASISVVQRRSVVTTMAATDDLPRKADQAQYDTGQGPCLDALDQRETARVTDMESESRGPELTARAAGLGVGSVLALQLYVAGDDLGALNLLQRPRRRVRRGGRARRAGQGHPDGTPGRHRRPGVRPARPGPARPATASSARSPATSPRAPASVGTAPPSAQSSQRGRAGR
jgi:hypothetical protein